MKWKWSAKENEIFLSFTLSHKLYQLEAYDPAIHAINRLGSDPAGRSQISFNHELK